MNKFLLIISAAILLPSCSIKQVEDSERTVSVSGTGTVYIDADKVNIGLEVKTNAKDPVTASAQNAEKMNRVYDALIASGVAKEEISTKDFSLYRERRYVNSNYVDGDYICENSISVSTSQKDKAGQFVDAAMKAGANSLSSLKYICSSPEMAMKQARTLAVKNCTENANLMAGTSGNMLGKLLTISESPASFLSNAGARTLAMYEAYDGSNSNKETPLQDGKLKYSITLYAKYELK